MLTSQRTLLGKLVRYAHANEAARPRLLPTIRKLAATIRTASKQATDKTAVRVDNPDFVEWALNQDVWKPGDVEKFVNGALRVPTGKALTRGGPRFKKGDLVLICVNRHKDSSTSTPYKKYDQRQGTVSSTDGDDVLVGFRGESEPVRFPLGMKSRGTGVLKYSEARVIQGSPAFEMIYKAGGKVTPDQQLAVEFYLGKGKGSEVRSGQYYTGHVIWARPGKSGWYFGGYPQQRMTVPGSSCDPSGNTFNARSFNPSKGKVHYIGLLGHRPRNWEGQLEEMRQEATPSGK